MKNQKLDPVALKTICDCKKNLYGKVFWPQL